MGGRLEMRFASFGEHFLIGKTLFRYAWPGY